MPADRALPIVLVGAMGAGKTTVGKMLAAAMGRRFLDSDDMIEARTGRTGREIAESEGVAVLHALERTVLHEALLAEDAPVVTAAASVVDDADTLRLLDRAVCIWLTADPGVLADRAAEGNKRRRIGSAERLGHRQALFEQVADLAIDTGRMSARDCVDQVLGSLAGNGPG